MTLPKDCFLALAAVGWADGNLDENEAAALLRTAREMGLPPQAIEEIEEAIRQRGPLTLLSSTELGRFDRVLTYALATWLARLDGVVTPEEKDSLRTLGDVLKLPDGIRTRASAAAFEVASLPTGDRPDRYDLWALREHLIAKLTGIEAE
jgi:uncharacterized membrane protein YebE (DUF533 family)